MGSRLPQIKLAVFVLLIWVFACSLSYKAIAAYIEHRSLQVRVDGMKQAYEADVNCLGDVLAEGNRLISDKSEQEQVLKDRLGLCQKDESPIVIIDEQTN